MYLTVLSKASTTPSQNTVDGEEKLCRMSYGVRLILSIMVQVLVTADSDGTIKSAVIRIR